MGWTDSKRSGLEHSMKSLVGTENISGEQDPFSNGIPNMFFIENADTPLWRLPFIAEEFSVTGLECDYEDTEFRKTVQYLIHIMNFSLPPSYSRHPKSHYLPPKYTSGSPGSLKCLLLVWGITSYVDTEGACQGSPGTLSRSGGCMCSGTHHAPTSLLAKSNQELKGEWPPPLGRLGLVSAW